MKLKKHLIVALAAASLTAAPSFAHGTGGQAAGQVGQQEVKQAQKALDDQGFNVGKIDGKFGPKTKQALMDFQKKQGLSASGQLDQQTISALGISGQQAGEASKKGEESSESTTTEKQESQGTSGVSGQESGTTGSSGQDMGTAGSSGQDTGATGSSSGQQGGSQGQ